MNLVRINAYASGYYSGNTYEDNILISKETFTKIEKDIKEMAFTVCELDGKHSEVDGEIDFDEFTEEELLTLKICTSCDGEKLYYELESVFNKNDLDLDKEIKLVEDYLKTLDKLTTVEFTIKESQIQLVKDFVENLSK